MITFIQSDINYDRTLLKSPDPTADTGIGNPKASTNEKGERLFQEVTEKMGELLVKLAKADTSNLYE